MMDTKAAKHWNLVSKVGMVCSFVMLVVGAALGTHTYLFVQSSVSVTGTIVELAEELSDQGSIMYSSVFTFVDAQDNFHRVQPSGSSSWPRGQVGDEVELLYDPGDPEGACENGFLGLWVPTTIVAGSGVFYSLLFWGIAWFTRRKLNANAGQPS